MLSWLAEKGVMDATLGHKFIVDGLVSPVLKQSNSKEEFMRHSDIPAIGFSLSIHRAEAKALKKEIEKIIELETEELARSITLDFLSTLSTEEAVKYTVMIVELEITPQELLDIFGTAYS
jgi:hypothetical protein